MKIKCIECGKDLGENDTDSPAYMTCDECMERLRLEIENDQEGDE